MKHPRTFIAGMVACLAIVLLVAADQYQPQVRTNAVLVVAASDSSAKAKKSADYVCDGTADQVEINAAINALPTTSTTIYNSDGGDAPATATGGAVYLCAGTYHTTAPIDMSPKLAVTLRGDGAASVIINGQTDGGHAVTCSVADPDTTFNWRTCVQDLMIQGNDNSGYGLYFWNGDSQRVLNVDCIKNGAGGLFIGGDGTSLGLGNKTISNCHFLRNGDYGIYIEDVHETLITGCHIEESDIGLCGDGCVNLSVSNCSVEDNATWGIQLKNNCKYPHITGVGCEDACYFGVYGYMAISGCEFLGTTIYNDGSSTLRVAIGASSLGNFAATDCNILNIADTAFTLDTISTTDMTMSACRAYLTGTIQTAGRLAIAGCTVYLTDPCLIQATAESAQIAYTGNTSTHGGTKRITIDGNGNTYTRLVCSGNLSRYSQFTFEDIRWATMSGNTFVGAGDVTFENCDRAISVTGNLFASGADLTINATCAGKFSILSNLADAADCVDNGTGTADNAGNTVYSGSGWNP